jgi:V-type H+-transporting ATPase subunit a
MWFSKPYYLKIQHEKHQYQTVSTNEHQAHASEAGSASAAVQDDEEEEEVMICFFFVFFFFF